MTPDTWTPARITHLRALWTEGLTATEIGRRIGVSKNAVIGKAHREGLASRPSPIAPRTDNGSAPIPRAARQRALHAVLPAVRLPMPQAAPKGRVAPCEWVLGVRPKWTKCDVPSVPGRLYCPAHCNAAYVSRVCEGVG